MAEIIGNDRSGSVEVRFEASRCLCPVTANVEVTHQARHPIGSTLLIRYDSQHPERADALQDRPNPYRILYAFLVSPAMPALLWAMVWGLLRRRRRVAVSLVQTTSPTNRVRVEAWRALKGNRRSAYLSLYAQAENGGTPLVVVPVRASAIRALSAGEFYDLYGTRHRLALRRGDLVIVSNGKTQPAEWEVGHRLPRSGIALGAGKPGDPLLPGDFDGPLFANAGEAARYRRVDSLARWLAPLLALIPILFFPMPDRLAEVGLGSFAALLAVLVVLWRLKGRFVGRVVARSPGPPPAGRAERLVARLSVRARLKAPDGRADLAGAVGTVVATLDAAERRASSWTLASMLLGVALFLLLTLRLLLP